VPATSPARTTATQQPTSNDVERLRHAVARLARLMRQQDEGDLGPTATAALASVRSRGPLTLGELAVSEHVSPPTMTKVVEKLEALGYITRDTDPNDRRVSRVTCTDAGSRYLAATRAARTEWLAARVADLSADERRRLAGTVGVLERLAGVDPADRP
jgi:DNA-binding MarR family transcriptional regulator